MSKLEEKITFKEKYFGFPVYMLTHPVAGFEEFKRYKRGKLSVAIIFLLLACLLSILSYQYTGFLVNEKNMQEFNSLKEIFYVVVPILVFCLANWSLTTLMDGKGKFKEIFMLTCYSLFPFLVGGFINLIFSNFIVEDEVAFYFIIKFSSYFLMGFMIFMGLLSIHEYSLGVGLLTILLTFVVVMVIIFIGLLFFDLIQQFIGFLTVIIREFILRYL